MNPVRAVGVGPIPTHARETGPVRVVARQAAAVAIGAFLTVVMGTFAAVVLWEPGETVKSGSPFLDRWFFGMLVVPIAYGIGRFLFRPRVVLDDTGVRVENPLESISMAWPAVAGARYDNRLDLVAADGAWVRSILWGPAFSGTFTNRARPEELVELVNAEVVRRGEFQPDPDSARNAEQLIRPGLRQEDPEDLLEPAREWAGPGPTRHASFGVPELIAHAVLWTLACVVAAALR